MNLSNTHRLNRTSLVTELDPALQLPVGVTQVMIMTAVAHPVVTAPPDVMVTVTEALPVVVATMRMIVVVTALHQELVVPLMITHLHVVDTMILTVVTTLLTHMPTVGLRTIDLHQEITHQEMLLMNSRDRAPVTGKLCFSLVPGIANMSIESRPVDMFHNTQM